MNTRYLIRSILRQHEVQPSQIDYSPRGKPIILHSHIACSITHSGEHWIMGVAKTSNLGIDSQINPPNKLSSLIKRCHLPKNTSSKDFLTQWMLKEAYSKCLDIALLPLLSTSIEVMCQNNQLHHGYNASPIPLAWVSGTTITNVKWLNVKK